MKKTSSSQQKRTHNRNSSDVDPNSYQNREDEKATVKTIKKV